MSKFISVWGSPGSGKTTISLAVAWELVRLKQNVLIINTDNTVPNLPVYLPKIKSSGDGQFSIGSMLENSMQTQDVLKGKIHLHPKSNNLGFMALESGETPLSYKAFEKNKMFSLIKLLQAQPIDYIIADCQSNVMYNAFSLLALENADVVIRALTPDVKGVEFNKSQCSWLSQSININMARQIKVASPCRGYSAVEEAGAVVGGFDFILPDNNETYIALSSGSPLGECASAVGKDFDAAIKKICERILQSNED